MPHAVPHITVSVQAPAKPWWRSRTLWVNAACLALAAAESQVGMLQGVVPGNVYAWLAFALPIVNVALRTITHTALGSSSANGHSATVVQSPPSPLEGPTQSATERPTEGQPL